MTVALIVGSCALLLMVLWVFSRFAWGGGMRRPSYALLKPQPDHAATGALPEADRDAIEIRCKECGFVQPMPDLAHMPVALSGALGPSAGDTRAACPHCSGMLQGWLRRDIKHRGRDGELEFSVLRRGTHRMFVLNGVVYPTLIALPAPARGLVAEALNETEESS